jgi:hypothetical protein
VVLDPGERLRARVHPAGCVRETGISALSTRVAQRIQAREQRIRGRGVASG